MIIEVGLSGGKPGVRVPKGFWKFVPGGERLTKARNKKNAMDLLIERKSPLFIFLRIDAQCQREKISFILLGGKWKITGGPGGAFS